MIAICLDGRLEEHLRGMEHSCGLYSYRTPEEIVDYLIVDEDSYPHQCIPGVGGAIFNYGIVAIYSEGYRSSHALIDTLFLPPFYCYSCLELGRLSPAEFIVCYIGSSPGGFCLSHLNEARIFPDPALPHRERPDIIAPVEVIPRELKGYYQVPIRSLRELVGKPRVWKI